MKPNILLICVDQQRWDCLGYAGQYPVKTPNIDRLAAEGRQYPYAFTPLPSCCPARQSLICGKRPERFGALWNYDQKIPVAALSPEEYSWARDLKEIGYRNGYVGKWHVNPVHTPLEYGYDDYISREELEEAERRNGPAGNPGGLFGNPSPSALSDAPTHRNAAEVIRLINRYGKEPWHIRMEFAEPHLPCRPAEPFASMYQNAVKWRAFDDTLEGKPYIQKQQRLNWRTETMDWDDLKETARLYYAFISQIDDAIGKVLQYLEHKGELDQTLIIYTSDHGDLCGDRHMMDKHYVMYDEVVRVPLILRYPALIPAGTASEEMTVNMLDLVPTLLELLDIRMPEHLQGKSLLPDLRGEQTEKRDYVLSTYNGQQFGLYMQRMLRGRDMKYIWNLTDCDELYDLKKDPYELVNRIGDPDYVESLKKMRLRLLKELKDQEDCILNPWTEPQLSEGRKLSASTDR